MALKLRTYRYRAVFKGEAKPPIVRRPNMVATGTLQSNKPSKMVEDDVASHLIAQGIKAEDVLSLVIIEVDQAVGMKTIDGQVIQ